MMKIIPREQIKHLEWNPDDNKQNSRSAAISKMKVFIASPGDVAEERDITSHVVAEINRMFGNPFGIQLEGIRWETHAWPDIGEDAQDVINSQIDEFDVLVGVMWKRFGTPTKRASSGTGEEFEKAYNLFKKYGRPKIMFYFRTTPFYTTDLKELSQFRKVAQFRKKLEELGVLYWTYNTPLEYERNVREHLIRQVLQITETENEITRPLKKVPKKERSTSKSAKECSIFMAYSHQDKEVVREVYHSLRGAGYKPWLDEQDLVPGQMWHREIDQAIRHADIVLFFLSSKTNFRQGFIAKEIELVTQKINQYSKAPFLIPVRIDNVELPTKLQHVQWVDYFTNDGLERLLEAIDRAWQNIQNRKNKDNIQ